MKTMSALIATMMMCLLGLALAGCLNVKADAGGRHEAKPPPDAPRAGTYDTRSAEQLRRDNSQLRAKLRKMEQDNSNWQAQVDSQKRDIDDLKRQRDQVKKERDRYKKQFGKDDD